MESTVWGLGFKGFAYREYIAIPPRVMPGVLYIGVSKA